MPKPPLKSVKVEKKPSRIYSEDEKRGACVLMFVHGTQEAVAKATGIPQRTISDWVRSEWWGDWTKALIKQSQDEFGAGWRDLIRKAQLGLRDRLDKGDVYLDKRGKERRRPISAKDLSVIAAIATDKDRILRGEPTSISGKAPNLKDAARQFAAIAGEKDKGAA